MKIALTGAGGTGKGTLGTKLATHYSMPFISSHIKETGEMMGINGSFKNTTGADQDMAFQHAIMFGQIYQERSLQLAGVESYLMERSTLDYIPYALRRGMEAPMYYKAARDWANKNYDLILFLPIEFVAPDAVENAWKERDPKDQEYTQNIIVDEILGNYTGKVMTLRGSVDERFEMAVEAIERIKRRSRVA